MGCGNSKIVHDESSETVPPSKLGPLLRHQLENIRRRRSRVADAMTLKESTLSKKELLKDTGNAPYSLEDTSSSRLSASNKQDCEDDEDARNSLSSLPATVDDDCKTLGRGKQPEETSTMSSKADDEKETQRLREEKVIAAVTAAIKQVYADEEETEAAKKEGDNNGDEGKDEDKADDDDDDSEMRAVGRSSLLQDDHSFPGSPSFRVYCMAPISADPENGIEEGRDVDVVDDTPTAASKSEDSGDTLESVDSTEDQESVTGDKNKSNASKGKGARALGKLFGRKRSGARKSLLSVKSCYHPSCSGHDRTRLLSEKPADL